MRDDKHEMARQLLIEAIRPALDALDAGGEAAEQLVLGTAIQESLLIHRVQLGGGPARGLFQMEPFTHDDCWESYLDHRPELADKVKSTLRDGEELGAATLEHNDRYAAAMCRVKYRRVPAGLPAAGDIEGMAA